MTDTANSPYRGAPGRTFWKRAVTGRQPSELTELFDRKFDINPETLIATSGSCFAQHIARHMRRRQFNVLDAEPTPKFMSPATAEKYGFGIYSARFGNIYYVRQLLQLAREALQEQSPTDIAWQGPGGRWWDSQRPGVEPEGLASPEHVLRHRAQHLTGVKRVFTEAEVLVFTMGLTEGWEHRDGTVYPTAPGTIAGSFDPNCHGFHNFSVGEIVADFSEFRSLVQEFNPEIKFLLTVSPVPLAATAADTHVLPATIYSKSVLRAAAGELAHTHSDIAYFPSYELVTANYTPTENFDATGRGVLLETVAMVMEHFFEEGTDGAEKTRPEPATTVPDTSHETGINDEDPVMCEEALLEAFGE